MKIKKVKCVELILDWNLWPRHESNKLDSTNIARMRESLQADIELPPIIVNESDYRVIDGFHRIKAYLSFYGDEAEISVIFKNYVDEKEMLLESISINSKHGLPLSPKDKAHAYLKARRMKIPFIRIAECMGQEVDSLKKFIEKRTATNPSGEKIALSYGAKELAGKNLNTNEMEYQVMADANVPIMHARKCLFAFKANAFKMTDNLRNILVELRDEIDRILKE